MTNHHVLPLTRAINEGGIEKHAIYLTCKELKLQNYEFIIDQENVPYGNRIFTAKYVKLAQSKKHF